MLTQFFNLIETSDELRIITRDDLIYFILVDKQRVYLIVKTLSCSNFTTRLSTFYYKKINKLSVILGQI